MDFLDIIWIVVCIVLVAVPDLVGDPHAISRLYSGSAPCPPDASDAVCPVRARVNADR